MVEWVSVSLPTTGMRLKIFGQVGQRLLTCQRDEYLQTQGQLVVIGDGEDLAGTVEEHVIRFLQGVHVDPERAGSDNRQRQTLELTATHTVKRSNFSQGLLSVVSSIGKWELSLQ